MVLLWVSTGLNRHVEEARKATAAREKDAQALKLEVAQLRSIKADSSAVAAPAKGTAHPTSLMGTSALAGPALLH